MADELQKTQDIEIDTDPIIKDVTEKVTRSLTEAQKQQQQDLAKQVSDSVSHEIVEKITGKKDPEPYQPKTWEQVREDAALEAEQRIEQKLKEREEQQKKQTEEQKKAEEERIRKANEYWDSQIKTMTEDGRLPKVSEEVQKKLDNKEPLTEEDKQDEGIQAQAKLYKLGAEHKEQNLELVYYKYMNDDSDNTGRTGAKAPVIGAGKSGISENRSNEFSYEDIHNTPIEEILNERVSE